MFWVGAERLVDKKFGDRQDVFSFLYQVHDKAGGPQQY